MSFAEVAAVLPEKPIILLPIGTVEQHGPHLPNNADNMVASYIATHAAAQTNALVAPNINYGVSPGDEAIPLPYLYVGPHEGPPAQDDFWNAAFGAYTVITDISSADDARAFFRVGRERVRTARNHSRSTRSTA